MKQPSIVFLRNHKYYEQVNLKNLTSTKFDIPLNHKMSSRNWTTKIGSSHWNYTNTIFPRFHISVNYLDFKILN